ncbi:MAG: peptidylprolyl isomerase [Bacteroidota bacterium]
MQKIHKIIFLTLVFAFLSITAKAQDVIIDQVVAIVGGNIIKVSDIEQQYNQMQIQGNLKGGDNVKCSILENILVSKLMLNQAKVDSVVVGEEQVESELERRIRYYISQVGSKEKFEEYYKKSVNEFKDEFRDNIRNQMLVQMMEGNITESKKVTPSEVKKFYDEIPSDSIPLINAEYEIGQIIRQPVISKAEKEVVKQRLNELRERILKGEKFASLAALYSEDPGSAKKSGELGLFGRGEMFPEFEAAAFNLKTPDQVSNVIETKAGYHILQLIERRGDFVNVRHILLMPKVSPYELQKAKLYLDSVLVIIKDSSMNFEKAALKYSDDPSRNNGGIMVNPNGGNSKFGADDIDPSLFFIIDKMKVGDISNPIVMNDNDGKQAFRIVYLKSRSSAHRANLKDDYDKIQNATLERIKGNAIKKWINDKIEKTYIKFYDNYKDCKFENVWVKK